MSIELDRKIQDRFDQLIQEAESLLEILDEYSRKHYVIYQEWQVKASGLLVMVYGESGELGKYLETIESYPGQTGGGVNTRWKEIYASSVESSVATMKGIRDNYVNGFLMSIEEQIIANVSADYMEQAEALLGEGIEGQFDHVPAAVLCGAVLENCLRSFCEQQEPPINVTKRDGSSKTLGPLIGELEKRKTFNKLVFKNLKSWSDIRNSAAHGKFDEFTRHDVEFMLSGVQQFLALHL